MKEIFSVPEIEVINVELDILTMASCPSDSGHQLPGCQADCDMDI